MYPRQAYHHMLEHVFRNGLEKPSHRDKQAFATATGLSYDYVQHWVCLLFVSKLHAQSLTSV